MVTKNKPSKQKSSKQIMESSMQTRLSLIAIVFSITITITITLVVSNCNRKF